MLPLYYFVDVQNLLLKNSILGVDRAMHTLFTHLFQWNSLSKFFFQAFQNNLSSNYPINNASLSPNFYLISTLQYADLSIQS